MRRLPTASIMPLLDPRIGRVALAVIAGSAVVLGSMSLPGSVYAAPASGPGAVSQTAAGALVGGTVPDGTCFAAVTATGGGGASSPTAGGTGGIGGAGASISATFAVLPGQSFGGSVGGGGTIPNGGSGDGAAGVGGAGGTITQQHRGGGGGGRSVVNLAGLPAVVAGGGGGGGAAHQNAPSGSGGGGGIGGIGAGVVAVGSTGQAGVDFDPNDGTTPVTANGGQGGQSATGGSGGTNSFSATLNGLPGGGTASGTGGNGGPDADFDSGGGGGGGYTGGGGGSSTAFSSVSGAGGGGGSSWVRGTSPVAPATAPTSIGGAAGAASPTSAGPGATGSVSIDWLPCLYALDIDKSVSVASVDAGASVVWSVTVTNPGPHAMTRGDTIDLSDVLTTVPSGGPGPAFEVLEVSTSGGSNATMASGPITCTGVTVGASMPSSTDCSRAYSALTSPEAPSGGVRGLDVGESLLIRYEQTVSNTAACGTITNTATTTERSSQSGTTDMVGVATTRSDDASLDVACYDLAVTKASDPDSAVQIGDTLTWIVTVTNASSVDMEGPDDTTANPLVVTDAFPTTDMGSPTLVSSSGPAGSCNLVGSTVTCANGLPGGTQQVLTFSQVVDPSTADGTVISNTASISDPATGDSNDSSTDTVTATVNEPPVAADDAETTDEDVPVTIDLLDNDTDADGTLVPSSVSVITAPTNGTVSIDPATGAATYTPNPDFNGVDTFEYEVCDDDGLCDVALVTVTIIAVADAPVAVDDAVTTDPGTPVTIEVRTNDDDVDGDTLSVTEHTQAANGTVSCTATECTYTPDAGFTGEDAFEYTVCDASGRCDTATVTISVLGGQPSLPNTAATGADAEPPTRIGMVLVLIVGILGFIRSTRLRKFERAVGR